VVAIMVIGTNSGSREVSLLLADVPGFSCEGPFSTMADAARSIQRVTPDAVIISDDVRGVDGIEGARLVQQLAPRARVLLVLHDFAVRHIKDAFAAGVVAVTGVLPPDELARALRSTLVGVPFVERQLALELTERALDPFAGHHLEQSPLTRREVEVLHLLAQGLDPRRIAEELHISVHTARGHVKRILAKLDVHSQLEAVVVANNSGLLDDIQRTGSRH